MNVLNYKGYQGRVEYDPEEEIFHGEVMHLDDVVTFQGRSVEELKQALEDSIEDYLELCASMGRSPEKPYSGRFNVRISPELHQRIVNSALRDGKPLNTWVTEILDHATQETNPAEPLVDFFRRSPLTDLDLESVRNREITTSSPGESMTDVKRIREAIIQALPLETSNFGTAPDANHIYIPPAHLKALRPESHLVVGARGVGKSLWTAALGSEEIRNVLGRAVPELKTARIHIGFSATERIDDYPNADTFTRLMQENISSYDIWRSVVVRQLAREVLKRRIPSERWIDTVTWLTRNPEDIARLMQEAGQRLETGGESGLFVFDALDRAGNNWQAMDEIVRGLLRTALWLKTHVRLSAKIFLREDQFERTVTDFPDASKLLATKTELAWAQHDLHGLLWQMLLNAPYESGEVLRDVYHSKMNTLPEESDNGFRLAENAKREGSAQRALFEALAGPWMGRDRRRGVPYVWSVSHLADSRRRTSPRSFLVAIRQAAEDSLQRYPDHERALHFESIKRGIQKASELRVGEMAEDYPWIRDLLLPLTGLTVPCDFGQVVQRWQASFPQGLTTKPSRGLPPQRSGHDWEGIREELLRIGLFAQKQDGRIDMPDLYRVGFGLGRRGGVKPEN